MFTLKYLVGFSLILLVSSQSWGQQSFGSNNQGIFRPLWHPAFIRRYLGFEQQQQQQQRSFGSSGFGQNSNQQGFGTNGQGFGRSNQQGFGQSQVSNQQGFSGNSQSNGGFGQQGYGQDQESSRQGFEMNSQGFGGSNQQGFGPTQGFNHRGQPQQNPPKQGFQSGGFNSQQLFGGQSGFAGRGDFGGQSGFGGNSGLGGNNFGNNNKNQGGFQNGFQNRGGSQRHQGGFSFNSGFGNSNRGTFEPIPPFLNNVRTSAVQDYYKIINNQSLTTNQINEQAENWASTNGVQIQYTQYKTNRTAVHNQATQNVHNIINNLATVQVSIENIQSNKSSSANDRQAAFQQLQQDHPMEYSVLTSLQNQHEQSQYLKMNGNGYNSNGNFGNYENSNSFGLNANYGNNVYGNYYSESSTASSVATKQRTTKSPSR